jgi:hypothetical protein
MASTTAPSSPAAPQGETRTTHDQSLNADATPAAAGPARPRVEPQLPHEIDESAHSQADASVGQEDIGKQAYEDAVGPTQDTDKAPVTDAVYNGALAPDRGDTPPRR